MKITREQAYDILGLVRLSCFNNAYSRRAHVTARIVESDMLANRLIRHSIVAAKVAEALARPLGLDTEKSYILGLLHDVGRFQHARFHGLMGYKFCTQLKEKVNDASLKESLDELARINISHTFIYNDLSNVFNMFRQNNPQKLPNNETYNRDEKESRVAFESVIINNYDMVVTMADFLSVGDTLQPATLAERLADIRARYNKIETPESVENFNVFANHKKALQNYFEDKIGGKLEDVLRPLPSEKDEDYPVLRSDMRFRRVFKNGFEKTFIPRFYQSCARILER